MPADSGVLLIGGVSHTGKSTLAGAIAERLGWRSLSTDQLARHPGRPWRDDGSSLPDDVVAHYQQLAPEQLADEVMDHYRVNVWPVVAALVKSHQNNPFDPHLVFEGSAILPDRASTIALRRVRSVFLRADADFLSQRIRFSSGYVQKSAQDQQMIDAFIARALLLNNQLEAQAKKAGVSVYDAADSNLLEQILAVASALSNND